MPWEKGKSGNPGGRPKENAEIKDLAREHGPAAEQKLCELMNHGTPQVQLGAAIALLDRAYGKPAQALEHPGKDGGAIQHQHNVDAFIAEMKRLRENMEKTELQ